MWCRSLTLREWLQTVTSFNPRCFHSKPRLEKLIGIAWYRLCSPSSPQRGEIFQFLVEEVVLTTTENRWEPVMVEECWIPNPVLSLPMFLQLYLEIRRLNYFLFSNVRLVQSPIAACVNMELPHFRPPEPPGNCLGGPFYLPTLDPHKTLTHSPASAAASPSYSKGKWNKRTRWGCHKGWQSLAWWRISKVHLAIPQCTMWILKQNRNSRPKGVSEN